AMANLDEGMERLRGHQGERAAGKFERVDIRRHGIEEILQIMSPRHRVVRPPDLGNAAGPRLSGRPVHFEKVEAGIDGHHTLLVSSIADGLGTRANNDISDSIGTLSSRLTMSTISPESLSPA